MRSRKSIDPELHLLRSAARLIEDGKARQQFENARFCLFTAFEQREVEVARGWARAIAVDLLVIPAEARAFATEALETIKHAIDEEDSE